MNVAKELVLISRAWCHLCHEMEAAVKPILTEYGATLLVKDADADPTLERYDELVPVLLLDDEEICHYVLDEARLREALGKAADVAHGCLPS
ncbi:MAG: glutaredoxin family protein [Zoogloeaceae bacterium]|jgi:thioredoxin reductase (NADPH)|nr:glutaredoxin family protein [Zoogloeaceae bacterium]